jgi:hypothetical protein
LLVTSVHEEQENPERKMEREKKRIAVVVVTGEVEGVNWEREKERDKDRDPVGDAAVGELLLWPFSSNSWCSKP